MTDISSGMVIDTGSSFRIGDAVGRTFSILGRNCLPFITLSGIAALPYLYFYWTLSGAAFASRTPIAANAGKNIATSFILLLLVGPLLKSLTQAVIVNGAFQDMRDHKVRIGDSVRVGFARILPVLGLTICYLAGYAVGMMLLFVPGIILAMMWYVAMPVCVVEKLGPLKSLGRSRMLTKGHRWKLLGLAVVIGVVAFVLGASFPIVGRMIGGRIGMVVVQYLIQAVVGAFSAILVVVIYRDLRVAKEGIDTDRIAAVFD